MTIVIYEPGEDGIINIDKPQWVFEMPEDKGS